MIASEIIFITLNKNLSSSVYILNDEEDLVCKYMHYAPNVMARNRVDIDANLWMTAIDLYLERSVDNVKDECYDRGKCIEAKIYEQRFMNLCDLPWDINKEEKTTLGIALMKIILKKRHLQDLFGSSIAAILTFVQVISRCLDTQSCNVTINILHIDVTFFR